MIVTNESKYLKFVMKENNIRGLTPPIFFGACNCGNCGKKEANYTKEKTDFSIVKFVTGLFCFRTKR